MVYSIREDDLGEDMAGGLLALLDACHKEMNTHKTEVNQSKPFKPNEKYRPSL